MHLYLILNDGLLRLPNMYDKFILMFQEELAATFRVNEFGSGGCWSDWEGYTFQLHRKAARCLVNQNYRKGETG